MVKHYCMNSVLQILFLFMYDNQDITLKTPLMKATRNGKIEAVKRLIAAGITKSVFFILTKKMFLCKV